MLPAPLTIAKRHQARTNRGGSLCRLWLMLPMLHPISLPGRRGQPPHTDSWVTMSGCNLPGEFSGAGSVFHPEKNDGHFFLVLSVTSCLETHGRARKAVPPVCRATQGCPQRMCWWSVMGLAGQPRHRGGLQVLTSLPTGSLSAFCKALCSSLRSAGLNTPSAPTVSTCVGNIHA